MEELNVMKRILTIGFACVLAIAGLSVGCKKAAPNANENGGKRVIVIGMVAKSQTNDVFQAAYTGTKNAAKELGDQYNATVTIDWRTPASEDAAKQVEAV